jgi:hypothetical protein
MGQGFLDSSAAAQSRASMTPLGAAMVGIVDDALARVLDSSRLLSRPALEGFDQIWDNLQGAELNPAPARTSALERRTDYLPAAAPVAQGIAGRAALDQYFARTAADEDIVEDE